tara:strand:- start:155 stop:301 length:147 start_codon:yes stop_codon:yes gene_type:complete
MPSNNLLNVLDRDRVVPDRLGRVVPARVVLARVVLDRASLVPGVLPEC